MRICVDDTKCVGIGLCEARLPELIAVSDDGFAVVTPGEIPVELVTRRRRGRRQLPQRCAEPVALRASKRRSSCPTS